MSVTKLYHFYASYRLFFDKVLTINHSMPMSFEQIGRFIDFKPITKFRSARLNVLGIEYSNWRGYFRLFGTFRLTMGCTLLLILTFMISQLTIALNLEFTMWALPSSNPVILTF